MKDCACSPAQIHRYLARISGPLLDRIDLHIDVPEVKYKDLVRDPDGEPSATIAKRVSNARKRQLNRYRKEGYLCNAQIGPRELRSACSLGKGARRQLEEAIKRLSLSARAYDRILKISRTIRSWLASLSLTTTFGPSE